MPPSACQEPSRARTPPIPMPPAPSPSPSSTLQTAPGNELIKDTLMLCLACPSSGFLFLCVLLSGSPVSKLESYCGHFRRPGRKRDCRGLAGMSCVWACRTLLCLCQKVGKKPGSHAWWQRSLMSGTCETEVGRPVLGYITRE